MAQDKLKKEGTPATSHNPWDSTSILTGALELNGLGRNSIEIPSPGNLRRLRQVDPETARMEEAHRTFMHKTIQTEGKCDGFSDNIIRQRIVLWDLINGFNEE